MDIISYHHSVKDVQAVFGASGPIFAASSGPFERPGWFSLLEQTELKPLYAAAKDGQTQVMLALMRERRSLSTLRNWYAFTWRACGPNSDASEELIAKIACGLKSKTHRVTMQPVPNEDGSADRLARAFADAGWRVEVSQCDTNHVIHLEGKSFAEYWAERPGPLRTTLKRKANKVTTHIAAQFDAEMWAHYEHIYSASWKPKEDNPEMLRAFAKAEGSEGRLRLGLAYRDNIPIAAQFWTVENGRAYIHKLAHREDQKHLSAGTTLSAAMFEYVIDRDKVQSVDFGTGDEAYKSDWMGETRSRYRIDCLKMRSPLAWLDLAKIAFHRLRDERVPMLASPPSAG